MSREQPIPRRTRTPLTRRSVLQGVGATLALPWLEALAPLGRAAADDKRPPVRLLYMFVPNGVHAPTWKLKDEGPLTKLSPALEPLAAVRDHVMVLSGLDQHQAKALGDGPGDHARSAAVFLTGAHPVKTASKNIRVGMSVDQVAAGVLAPQTVLPSLELGLERSRTSGRCDSGYSCAYTSNISWRDASTPNPKEVDPRKVFERMFHRGRPGESETARRARVAGERSVLDLVRDQARRLAGRVGVEDRAKLDQYLTSVREIERRIEAAEREADALRAKLGVVTPPTGIPKDRREHARLMADLCVLAFRTDMTRVITYMVGNGGSNLSYRFLGVPEGHHGLSHHGKDKAKIAKIQRIDRWLVEQFVYLVEQLREAKDERGSLLDQSLVLYGSGIRDGNRHDHHDLPILLAGRGHGAARPGRHMRVKGRRPLNDLFLTMLHAAGVPATRLGDSTGPLPGLV